MAPDVLPVAARRVRPRSLRTRLVATALLLLAVASALIAGVTTIELRDYLVAQLDDDLRVSSTMIARIGPPPAGGAGLPELGNLPRPPDSLVAVVRDGAVVSATVYPRAGGSQALSESEYAELSGLAADGRSHSVALGDLGEYRIMAQAVGDGDFFVAGQSEDRVEAIVARLVTTELIVAAVVLIVAGIAGAVVVGRELRPLERVAATAARVSALPLDRGEVSLAERVPDADSRTEVGQVGTALNRMLDHVGAALEARHDSEVRLRRFIADASHELRTPLAAIRGYAELSRRQQLPDETAYSLTRISSQAERMTTLVEDLLLLARLDAGRPLERREVDLTRLAVDAVRDAHAAGPAHRWFLNVPEEPVSVCGDAMRLAQVLANLLANVRTHTPAGTAVAVVVATEPGFARLSVVDQGPGIAPDLLPHVFERFARGSASRSRQNGSTGLGLAIVHAVVTAHGGTVAVASRPGRTEFAMRLPSPPPMCPPSSPRFAPIHHPPSPPPHPGAR
jgi:two-component system, OmpR family, sensor kinase